MVVLNRQLLDISLRSRVFCDVGTNDYLWSSHPLCVDQRCNTWCLLGCMSIAVPLDIFSIFSQAAYFITRLSALSASKLQVLENCSLSSLYRGCPSSFPPHVSYQDSQLLVQETNSQ